MISLKNKTYFYRVFHLNYQAWFYVVYIWDKQELLRNVMFLLAWTLLLQCATGSAACNEQTFLLWYHILHGDKNTSVQSHRLCVFLWIQWKVPGTIGACGEQANCKWHFYHRAAWNVLSLETRPSVHLYTTTSTLKLSSGWIPWCLEQTLAGVVSMVYEQHGIRKIMSVYQTEL